MHSRITDNTFIKSNAGWQRYSRSHSVLIELNEVGQQGRRPSWSDRSTSVIIHGVSRTLICRHHWRPHFNYSLRCITHSHRLPWQLLQRLYSSGGFRGGQSERPPSLLSGDLAAPRALPGVWLPKAHQPTHWRSCGYFHASAVFQGDGWYISFPQLICLYLKLLTLNYVSII